MNLKEKMKKTKENWPKNNWGIDQELREQGRNQAIDEMNRILDESPL